jgi:hypothetical protein
VPHFHGAEFTLGKARGSVNGPKVPIRLLAPATLAASPETYLPGDGRACRWSDNLSESEPNQGQNRGEPPASPGSGKSRL